MKGSVITHNIFLILWWVVVVAEQITCSLVVGRFIRQGSNQSRSGQRRGMQGSVRVLL